VLLVHVLNKSVFQTEEAVQRTLKSLLQHHSSKASILWHSAFFTVQLSHCTTKIKRDLDAADGSEDPELLPG